MMLRVVTTGLASSTLLLLISLTGCPGSGGSSSGGGSGTCSSYYDGLSAYLTRCGETEANLLVSARPRFEDLCSKALAAPGATNLSGQLAQCSSQLSTTACGDDTDCVSGAGSLVDGTACGEGYQCASGFCKKAQIPIGTNSTQEGPCGSCAPRVPVGGVCPSGSSKECVDDARCVTGAGGAGSGKCVAIKIGKAGDPCASSAEQVDCDTGLHCFFPPPPATGGSTTPAVCRAPVGEGGDCTSKRDCTSSLSCVKNKCAAPLNEGAPCTGSECATGLACDKTCKRVVTVKTGEECDSVRRCERGSCRGSSITSTPSGTTVTPGKCVDPLPDGAACTNEGGTTPRCDVFAECIQGKCTVPDPSSCK